FDDVVVARAAAEVAFELVPNGAVIEIVALAIDHVEGGHDHTGRAVAALEPVMLAKRLLHGMQRAGGIGQTFDGQNIRPFDLPHEHRAGFHGFTVDVHHASTA